MLALAPMAVLSFLTSSDGPAISEVPVSTIPLQPPSHISILLPAVMLHQKDYHQHHTHTRNKIDYDYLSTLIL